MLPAGFIASEGCERPVPGNGVWICPVWAQNNKAFYNPLQQWTSKSGDPGNGPVHEPKTRSQLFCPGWPTWEVGRKRNTKKCHFLVLVHKYHNSYCVLATMGTLGHILAVSSQNILPAQTTHRETPPLVIAFLTFSPFLFLQNRTLWMIIARVDSLQIFIHMPSVSLYHAPCGWCSLCICGV